MKTLTPTLLAAQKKAARIPYIEAKVYDYEAGIKRLSWERVYEGAEPDNHHGIAFDGQASMHRIRAGSNNKLYYQKQTLPFGVPASFPMTFPIDLKDPPALDQWTEIASDCAGPCAIAAYGTKVYIFYRKTDNTLRKYYSHDYGENWTNAELVAYADAVALAAAWWGTGNNVVCLALKGSLPAKLYAFVLNTTNQSTVATREWSDGNHPLITTYGLGATFITEPESSIAIVLAGKESDSPYNHYDLFRTKLSASYNFLAMESFLMAPDGENITYEYPDCHLQSSPQEYETIRITAVEKFAGTTAYTRPITSHMVKGTYWPDTTFTEPRPLLPDVSPAYGLRIQSTADYWWLSTPGGLWRAERGAQEPLDLTPDIVSLTQKVPGNLVITLDNSKGQYATPGSGALASLRFRSEIALRLGYRTTAGPEAVDAGRYWIDSWQWTSSTNQSLFAITAIDGWGLLKYWSARYQMRWNKDDVTPRSVWQILYQLLARVAICLVTRDGVPRSNAIDNFYPDFTINPGTPGDTAVNRLLSCVPDRLIFDGQQAYVKDLRPDEDPCYEYGTDHKILSGSYSQHTTASRARAIGRDEDANRILEEALDTDLLDLGIDILQQVYDPNLQTATSAQERADALLRQEAQRAQGAQITVPTNVAQELYDVITITDPRCEIDQAKYRVPAMHTHHDRRHGICIQRLTLCAP